MKRGMVIGAVLAVFCLSTSVMANPLDFQLPGPEVLRGLDLAEQQKEQLKAIKENLAGELKPLGEALREKVKELRQLFQAEEIDETAVTAKAAEISDIRGTLMTTTIKSYIDVSKVLTPEQRKKVQARIKERTAKSAEIGERRGQHDRRGREGGQGPLPRRPEGPRYRQGGQRGEGASRWRKPPTQGRY